MSANPTYYKFLNGREATFVPGFRYRLRVWQPPVEDDLVACENGYHVLEEHHLPGEFIGRDMFVAEVKGDLIHAGDKTVARQCRIVEHLTGWNERTARLFAADCAERLLPFWETHGPGDGSLLDAIQVVRDCVDGKIDWQPALPGLVISWPSRWPSDPLLGDPIDASRGVVFGMLEDARDVLTYAVRNGWAPFDIARKASQRARQAIAWSFGEDFAPDAAPFADWPGWTDEMLKEHEKEREWQANRLLSYAYGSVR